MSAYPKTPSHDKAEGKAIKDAAKHAKAANASAKPLGSPPGVVETVPPQIVSAEIIQPSTSESAAWLDEQEKAIRFHGSRSLSDIIEVGRRLAAVKKHLDHGEWLPWLEHRFQWSEDTAENLIAIFHLHRQIPEAGRNLMLPLSGLYVLGRHTTPPEAIEAIVAKATAGEKVTVAEIKETVTKARRKRKPKLPSYKPQAEALPSSAPQNANLGRAAAAKSKEHLQWFAVACRQYLPYVTVEEHRQEARRLVAELTDGAQ